MSDGSSRSPSPSQVDAKSEKSDGSASPRVSGSPEQQKVAGRKRVSPRALPAVLSEPWPDRALWHLMYGIWLMGCTSQELWIQMVRPQPAADGRY
jgi:hypothetical protein